MDASASSASESASEFQAAPEPELPRTDTGLRILYTIVFSIILNLAGGLLTLLVAIQLILALITRETPHARLKQFAELTTRYCVLIVRYVTFTDDEPPFPFSDFPEKSPEA